MPIDVRLFQQCDDVYQAMAANSEPRLFDEDSLPELRGKTYAVYTGFTTYLIESIGLTISNYTPVMRRLQTMRCILQLQRGGRGIPSEWVLFKPPNESDFSLAKNWRQSERTRLARLEERVASLEADTRSMS